MDILLLVEELTAKDTKTGCAAMERLAEQAKTDPAVAEYIGAFIRMLSHKNSYVRNRAVTLLAACAKWDSSREIESDLPKLTALLADDKPITVRTAITALREIALSLPETRAAIISALKQIDTSKYKDSMAPLIQKDAKAALAALE